MSRPTPDSGVRRLFAVAHLRPLPMAGLAVVSAAQALLVTPAPFLVQRAFEVATAGGTRTRLVWLVAAMVALMLASEAIALWVKFAALRLIKPAVVRLRAQLALCIVFLPLDHVEQRRAEVHDVFVHDTERVDVMLHAVAALALPAALLVLVLCSVLVVAHPWFGLATSVTAILVASAERLARRRMHERFDASHRTFGDVSRGAWSMLSGFLVTRSHGAEQHEVSVRRTEAVAASEASEAAARAMAVAAAISRAATAVAFGMLLLGAGILVQQHLMSIPAMLASYATIALLRAPLNTLGLVAPQVQEGWSAWQRVAALLVVSSDAHREGGDAPPPGADLVVDRVSCRHGERRLFSDVSFTIRPGEVVALTGPNGAGKTTLIRQILGLTRPSAGVIRIGDTDLDRVDLAAWRRTLGVVLQESWMFDGTVRDNLVYGAEGASSADIIQAVALARADDLLRQLPDGIDTRIGAGGIRLSDGQRQRLAIARALVRKPRLLILDEPTNHLDEVTARAIVDGIVAHPARPAVLLVTHVRAVAASADRVYELSDGRLVSRTPAPPALAGSGVRPAE